MFVSYGSGGLAVDIMLMVMLMFMFMQVLMLMVMVMRVFVMAVRFRARQSAFRNGYVSRGNFAPHHLAYFEPPPINRQLGEFGAQ